MKFYYLKRPVKMRQHMRILSLFQVQLYPKISKYFPISMGTKRQVQIKKKTDIYFSSKLF